MTAYILQAILFQLLFLLVYEFLLKKETFFTYNRWYLLITTALSLILPLIKIETLSILVPPESLTQMSTILLPEVFIGRGTAAERIEPLSAVMIEPSGTGISPWLVIYLLGVLTALVIVLKKYSDLSRMFRFKKIAAKGHVNIIEVPNSSIACTFYKTIFLGDLLTETEKQHILSHELVHVKQKHSLDLIFFEVLKVILWFNPLIYIYQNRIATIHEFIADAAVVKITEKRSYYDQLLNSAFNTQNISFINQFINHSLIKKRIIMLQRSRSKAQARFKYLVIVPLILVMLTYVACSESKTIIEESNNNTTALDDDALRKMYREQLKQMEESGASEKEIQDAFFITLSEVRSREEFYKSHTYLVFIEKKDFEKNNVEGKYNEEDRKKFLDGWENLTYEEYLAYSSSQSPKINYEDLFSKDFSSNFPEVPFAVMDQVPIFPGCENLELHEEQKNCISENIQEFVTENFDTGLGSKLGLTGVIRLMVVFQINPEGKVTEVRSRAPHPDLEAEAKRVVESLPEMIPGVHNGQKVGVSYALPIIFQVNE